MDYDQKPLPGQKTKVNTAYFAEDIVRDGIGGCCHDFAVALHRRTGWPIAAFWNDPSQDRHAIFVDPVPVHVVCVAQDGRAVDVEGAHQVKDLGRLYAARGWRNEPLRFTVHGDEAAWAKLCESPENEGARTLAPREYRVEAAARCIEGSPKFLALVAEIERPAPARASRQERGRDR